MTPHRVLVSTLVPDLAGTREIKGTATMGRRGTTGLLGLAVAVLAGCTGTTGNKGPTEDVSQASESRTLVLPAGKAHAGPESIALTQTTRVTWITDRPVRDAGSYRLADLVDRWAGYGFDEDPPNAVLTGVSPLGLPRWIAVEIAKPQIDGSTTTFPATYLNSAPRGTLELSDTSLVIDGTGGDASGDSSPQDRELDEITQQLTSTLSTLQTDESNLDSQWTNLGLDAALALGALGDLNDAISALQQAIAQIDATSDPDLASIEDIISATESTVQDDLDQMSETINEASEVQQALINSLLVSPLL